MTTTRSTQPAIPIACDMAAIAADQREAHAARAKRLLETEFQERHELPAGFAWRFSADQYDDVSMFVGNERRCCPFLSFTLELTPGHGPIWLRITGSADGKAALLAGMGEAANT